MFIAFLYMFRATMCPSSEENTRTYATSGICHSVYMAVWYALHTWQVIYVEWQIPGVA